MQYAIENHSLDVLLVGTANLYPKKIYPKTNSRYEHLAYTLRQPLLNTTNK